MRLKDSAKLKGGIKEKNLKKKKVNFLGNVTKNSNSIKRGIISYVLAPTTLQ